jgi:hypothetical protein
MNRHHLPVGVPFEKHTNKWGGIYITVPNDISEHYLDPQQRWLPHAINDPNHPAKIGDMVTLRYKLSCTDLTVAFVSGIRTFKKYKNGPGIRQVELLGIPCRWYAISHFEEYGDSHRAMVYCGSPVTTTQLVDAE